MAAAVETIDAYVAGLPGETRRLAHGEWGVTLPPEQGSGWPLDLGLRLVDGLVQAKALALSDGTAIDPWMLLWWNRQTRLVRFGATRSRELWVHADLPAGAIDERELDRLLGLVVEAALAVRTSRRVPDEQGEGDDEESP